MGLGSWMLWYREQRFPLTSAFRERVPDMWQRLKEHRAERKHWARAETLEDLGDVTARWLEGEFKYHPGGYDEGPADETREIAPALVALNRAGFVTSSSQPGWMGPSGFGWDVHQRAAVDGFADEDTADRLEAVCADTGLIFIRNGPARWRSNWYNGVTVTATPPEGTDRITEDTDYWAHTGFGAHLSRHQVKFTFDGYGYSALRQAEQITIIDPEWGRRDYLWQTLVGDAHMPLNEEPTSGLLTDYEVEHQPRTDRTWDGSPETSAETRFFDLRESGYTGWIDENGYAVGCPLCDEPGCTEDIAAHAGDSLNREHGPGITEPPDDWNPWADLDVYDYYGSESAPNTSQPYFLDLINRIDEVVDPEPPQVELKPSDLDPSGIDPRLIQEARDWVTDCTWKEDPEDIEEYSDAEIVRGVERHYVGGWAAFVHNTGELDDNNGGSAMTAPAAPTATGDVVSIADLRDIYQRTAPAMAGVQEQQSAAAAGFRAQAAAYEAAVGGLTAEGHDQQTVAEAMAAMEAMHEAARLSDEAAAAADAAQGAIEGALQGLERHRALEEAVASHAGPATRTDAYAPR